MHERGSIAVSHASFHFSLLLQYAIGNHDETNLSNSSLLVPGQLELPQARQVLGFCNRDMEYCDINATQVASIRIDSKLEGGLVDTDDSSVERLRWTRIATVVRDLDLLQIQVQTKQIVWRDREWRRENPPVHDFITSWRRQTAWVVVHVAVLEVGVHERRVRRPVCKREQRSLASGLHNAKCLAGLAWHLQRNGRRVHWVRTTDAVKDGSNERVGVAQVLLLQEHTDHCDVPVGVHVHEMEFTIMRLAVDRVLCWRVDVELRQRVRGLIRGDGAGFWN